MARAHATSSSPDSAPVVPGACGVVKDGVIPGCYGYEAGQSAVGDIFGWFVEHSVPPVLLRKGTGARSPPSTRSSRKRPAHSKPGESGLLALDWWNGNRSVLVDADLTGLMLGMTLLTQAPEMYRALIEATAFGTRTIIDAFEAGRDQDRQTSWRAADCPSATSC